MCEVTKLNRDTFSTNRLIRLKYTHSPSEGKIGQLHGRSLVQIVFKKKCKCTEYNPGGGVLTYLAERGCAARMGHFFTRNP